MWTTPCLLVLLFSNFFASSNNLPSVTFAQLRLSQASDWLRQANNGQLGAFVITHLDLEYQKAVGTLQKEAPACLETHPGLPDLELNDGSFRTTFASMSGSNDGDGGSLDCLTGPLSVISETFEEVDDLVAEMIQRITGPLWIKDDEDVFKLNSAPVKSHLHVYKKDRLIKDHKRAKEMMVPFHVDNGMYLIITPFPGHGLQIESSSGHIINTDDLKHDSIIVLMGRGLTDWLLMDHPDQHMFQAVPHAVDTLMPSMSPRVIYARMKVAPLDAEPESSSSLPDYSIKLTFGDVFYNQGSIEPDQLCATDLDGTEKVIVKRDHHASAEDELCQAGESYCWMGCRPLQNCNSTDVNVCYSTVSNITCGTTFDSPIMDPDCKWECMEKPEEPLNDYCNGGMDMLMQGFETAHADKQKMCIILFIKPWTLNSRAKFIVACLGVAVLGFGIELCIAVRRLVSSRKGYFMRIRPMTRKLLMTALFALNLVLGYLAMLVAMTYSVELFICVVIGITIGHFFFNTKTPVGESIDPCCASQNNCSSKAAVINLTRTPCDIEGHDDGDDSGSEDELKSNCCSSNHHPESNGITKPIVHIQ